MKKRSVILLCAILSALHSFSQSTKANIGGNVRTNNTDFLGWDNTGTLGTLEIRNDFNGAPIWFFTGGTLPTDRRMAIRGNAGPFAGFVGIGSNFVTPLDLLDVRNGNINIGSGTLANVPNSPQAYKIGGNEVLWLGPVPFTSNILCGVGAGASLNGGGQNTLMGNLAGTNLTVGGGNTAFGFEALRDNVNTASNVAIGWRALQRNLVQQNTAVGTEAMRFNQTAFQNTAVGCEALRNNVDGIQNVAVGYQSLKFTTGNQITGVGQENTACGNQVLTSNQLGSRNSGFGDDVLFNNQGNCNTALGSEAMSFNTSGNANTAVGQQAAVNNRNGNWNTAIGDSVLYFNRTGDQNTVSGAYAGFGVPNNSHSRNSFYGFESDFNITVGHDNMFGGYRSGFSNTTGNLNTGVGADVMYDNTSGSRNSALGDSALKSNTTGNLNTVAGYKAGYTNQTGSLNTIIGANADMGGPNAISLRNAAAIGANSIVTETNKMILGNDAVNVGIGLSNDVTTVGFFGPNNKLEIDAGLGATPHDPSPGGVLGASGLRFRDLHAGGPLNYQGVAITENITQPNQFSTPAVLSVDINGDVILVPDAGSGTGAGLGLCSTVPTTLTDLTGDARVGFAGYNVFFDGNGNGVTKNNFVIGAPCSYNPKAKLDVIQNATGSNSIGIRSENNDPSAPGLNSIAVKGIAIGPTSAAFVRVAGWFESPGAVFNPQVALFTPQYGGNWNLGFPFPDFVGGGNNSGLLNVNGSLMSNAGNFQASDSSMKHNIVTIEDGLDKILHLRPVTFEWDSIRDSLMVGKHAGFIAQEVQQVVPEIVHHVGGSDQISYAQFSPYIVSAIQKQQSEINTLEGGIRDTLRTGIIQVVSDANFKTNIDSITNASAIVSQLKPRSFYFDTANAMSTYHLKLNNQKQYGLIAQDVQTVLPELVGTTHRPAQYDATGNQIAPAVDFKNLNYNAFIALLIKSNQELQQRVAALENTVSSCCSNGARTTNNNNKNTIEVELSDADVVVLNQNQPNPFAEQTTITYQIPQNTGFAQILFYDINGRQIKAVDINKKGKGQLNVFANDLSNGVYSYTLVIDGKIIETKKMIRQQ